MKKTFLLLTIYCLLSTTAVFAQEPPKATEYELLAPILQLTTEPNKPDAKTSTAKTYIEGLFTLIIGIAGVLAVVKIIFGGIQYMSTEAIGGKSDARGTIENALWGLLLAISAWLILFTINPDLVNLDLKIPVQEIKSPTTIPGSGQIPGTGPGHLALTDALARGQLTNAGISILGPIQLAGIRQITVDEVINLKRSCNCEVSITSATGGSHASGACSHANGYKVDLRSRGGGATLTNYITNNYQQLHDRSDGTKMYISPTGGLYGLESNHWDVTRC